MCTVKGGNCTYVLSFSQSFLPLFHFPSLLLRHPQLTYLWLIYVFHFTLETSTFMTSLAPTKVCHVHNFYAIYSSCSVSLILLLFLFLCSYLLSGLHSICGAIKFWNSPLRDSWRIRNFNYFNNLFAMHKQIKPFANIYKLSSKCKTHAQAKYTHTQWYALKYAMEIANIYGLTR